MVWHDAHQVVRSVGMLYFPLDRDISLGHYGAGNGQSGSKSVKFIDRSLIVRPVSEGISFKTCVVAGVKSLIRRSRPEKA